MLSCYRKAKLFRWSLADGNRWDLLELRDASQSNDAVQDRRNFPHLGERELVETLSKDLVAPIGADIPLISRMPMLYTARTMTPARILHLRREDFERLLTARPRIALRWLLSAAQRMERTQRRLLEALGEDLQSQLCILLLDRADNGRVSLAQQTLADLVGAQRSSVNRVLKSLQRQGLISVAYREIDILDPEGLESRTSLGSFAVPERRLESGRTLS